MAVNKVRCNEVTIIDISDSTVTPEKLLEGETAYAANGEKIVGTMQQSKLPVLNPSYPADVSKTVVKGNTTSATFTVSIDTPGTPAEYTYQWYVNGSAVSGATGVSYTKDDLSTTATYTVYCEVTNKAGVITSRVAKLQVTQYYTPVLNNSYPANATVNSGTNATFSVSVSTAGVPSSYTYQWYVNNTAVSGATNSSYTRATSSDKGTYTVYCKVTNAAGTVQSRSATLTVNKTPVLNSSYPANATVAGKTSTTLKVTIATAGYPTTYTYQWYKGGTAISGATSSTYTFTPAAVGSTTFYCKVTNAAGTVQSRTATITSNGFVAYNAGTFNSSFQTSAVSFNTGSHLNLKANYTYTSDKLFDVTPYNKISVTGKGWSSGKMNISLLNSSNTSVATISHTVPDTAEKTYTLDISNVSGNCYFKCNHWAGDKDHYVNVTNITFTL